MISRSTNVREALRSRQRGFLLNPARFAGGGGGSSVWNSADKSASITLSISDRRATQSGTGGGVRGLSGKSSGLWYWEGEIISLGGSGSAGWGVANSATSIANPTNFGTLGGVYLVWRNDRLVAFQGNNAGFQGGTPAVGGLFGCSADFTSGCTATLYYNGTSFYSRSLGAGTYFPFFTAGPSGGSAIQHVVTPTYLPSGFTYWA